MCLTKETRHTLTGNWVFAVLLFDLQKNYLQQQFFCQHAVEQIGCTGTDFLSSILDMMLTFPISCRHLDPGGPKTMTVDTHSPRQTGPHRSQPSSSCCKEKNSQLPYKTLQLCPSELLMLHCKASAKLSFHFKTY